MEPMMSRLLGKKISSFKARSDDDWSLKREFRKYVIEHTKTIKSVEDIPSKFNRIMNNEER